MDKQELTKHKMLAGQTLIETLAAAFIMVMGVTAAAGLAIYVFGASTNIIKQIIATGLAREGVEAVKNMRDTNWLQDSAAADCWDYQTGNNASICYKSWLTAMYNISPAGGTKSYTLTVNPSAANFWVLTQQTSNKFGLNKRFSLADVAGSGFAGLFVPEIASGDGDSDYYREIKLTELTNAPFNQDNFHRILVQSRVWWTDKKCPRSQTFDSAGAACKVELQYDLTNWKNY